MHNFDLILNYFWEKYRENVKIWGTLYIGVPHSKFWGTCPPVPPRFTPLLKSAVDGALNQNKFHSMIIVRRSRFFGLVFFRMLNCMIMSS